uniref:Uncharacterized protein n=1 Tax=Plectus sambesii TaxID=2011161 RepID=A0A914X227_9BILA
MRRACLPSGEEWQRIVQRTHRWHIRSADQMGAPVVDEPGRCLCGMRQAATSDGSTALGRHCASVQRRRRVSTLLTRGGVGRALLSRTRPVEHRRLRQRHSTPASPLGRRPVRRLTPICAVKIYDRISNCDPSPAFPIMSFELSNSRDDRRRPIPPIVMLRWSVVMMNYGLHLVFVLEHDENDDRLLRRVDDDERAARRRRWRVTTLSGTNTSSKRPASFAYLFNDDAGVAGAPTCESCESQETGVHHHRRQHTTFCASL